MYDMILTSKPDLKIIDKNKLHISRKPSLLSWLLIFLSVIVFFQIFRRLTSNVFLTVVSLLGEILFGLETLGEWEDFRLDKLEKRVTVERSNWCEKLIFQKTNNTTMRLGEIRHVGVTMKMGLFILCRDGKIFCLDTRGLERREIQNYRREINYFLNMGKISRLNELGLDPYDRIIVTSDSEDDNNETKSFQNQIYRGDKFQ